MHFPPGFDTARMQLREAQLADAPAIYRAYATDPEVTRFLTWSPHRDLDDTIAYLQSCLASRAGGSANTYLITKSSDGTVLGAFDLRRETSTRLSFGYVLARPNWRQGIMSEVLREILRWCAEQSDIWRVWSFCDVDNQASTRTMETCGMEFEGILHRWFRHPNIAAEPRDCRAYAWYRS